MPDFQPDAPAANVANGAPLRAHIATPTREQQTQQFVQHEHEQTQQFVQHEQEGGFASAHDTGMEDGEDGEDGADESPSQLSETKA